MSQSKEISSAVTIDGRALQKRKKEKVNEQLLEAIVFGKESTVLENISKKSKQLSETIIEDRTPSDQKSKINYEEEDISDDSDSSEDVNYSRTEFFSDPNVNKELSDVIPESSSEKKIVWTDSDDLIAVSDALSKKLPKRVSIEDNYRNYLENKFNDLYKRPKWALKSGKDKRDESESDDSDDEDVGRTARNFKLKSNVLDQGILRLKKCTDLTHDNHQRVR